MDDRGTAGLAASVGQASVLTRVGIASAGLAVGVLVGTGGVMVARTSGLAGSIVAVVALFPFASIMLVAALYVSSPFSKFGLWLDRHLVKLHEWRMIVVVTAALWFLAIAMLALLKV